mmetsp:Transcript_5303/g.7733  ORF Transcript_5303/g.7733 Transcript_5303/m.7733 type:complete len:317 (-) Transcript_5303:33-983(-)
MEMEEDEDQMVLKEPSQDLLRSVTEPLVSTSVWSALTGREFYFPSTIAKLVPSALKALLHSNDIIDWKCDSKTKKLLENDKEMLRKSLDEDGEVLVWIGRFKKDGHGSELPIVKTHGMIHMSPKDLAELLMDSSRVDTYNKMTLGRTDEIIFQRGIDSNTEGEMTGLIEGEAKIVRNLTNPPLTKKLMEFVTLMHARRIHNSDDIGEGIVASAMPTCIEDNEKSYIVVSRAVSGGKWGTGKKIGKKNLNEEDEREVTRSEILLGVNLLRGVPGRPDETELTAITHVHSPSVPTILAGKVGVKGAVDFIKDIRAICQ